MRKNTLSIILVLVLGLSLFTVATVAASSTDVGYERFKDTLEEIQFDTMGSGDFSFTITDNGDLVLDGQIQAVGNEVDETFSGQIVLSSEEANALLSFYGVDETVYVMDPANEGYYKFISNETYYDEEDDFSNRYNHYNNDSHQMTQVEEELLDYFVGDLKDNFIVNQNDDGSKDLSFTMKDSEVPTLLNLMAKAASAADRRNGKFEDEALEADLPFMKDFEHNELTDLTEDVQIDEVAFDLSLDPDGQITSIGFRAVLSGKDASSTYHQLVVEFEGRFDYEDAEVKVMNIEGYDWEVIENTDDSRGHRR